MSTQVGLSFKEIIENITSFLEISFHTLLCLRLLYPTTTFTRRRAHGVPVYQSRHPVLQAYIAEVCSTIAKELEKGRLRRVTIVIKNVGTGVAAERWVWDFGILEGISEGRERELGLVGAPGLEEMSLMLRGFLIRLTALDGQLLDLKGENTWAVIIETKDDMEPSTNEVTDGSVPPWVPALQADTIRPPTQGDSPAHHEPLLHVKAIETGVIDVRLMVQECIGKTGVEKLNIAL